MIILCDPEASWRTSYRSVLSDPEITELGDLAAVRAALDDATGATPVILGPNLHSSEALDFATALDGSGRPVAVLMVVSELDPTVLRSALRAGVVDVLTQDGPTEDLTDALARALSEARQRLSPSSATSEEETARGKIVTVFSTKGGCGKSLVSSNLAILLAQREAEHGSENAVVLVDLDLQSGDLAIMLQVMPSLSIHDAAENVDRMDADAVDGYLTPHGSGIQLLAAPNDPALSEAVTPAAVATILSLLRTRHKWVVIDGPAFFTDQVLAALDQSDAVVLIASMDVPSVKSLRMALNTLGQLGISRERIITVLNRADSNVGLRIGDVEKSLKTGIDVPLPSSRDVPLSVNQGEPLAGTRRKSDVVDAIARIVPKLTGGVDPDDAAAKKPRFSLRR